MTASSSGVPLSERDTALLNAMLDWHTAVIQFGAASTIAFDQFRACAALQSPAGQASADGARDAEAGGVDEDLLRRRAFSIGITIDQARAVLALASTPTSTSAPEVAAPAGGHWCALEHGGVFCKVCDEQVITSPAPATEPPEAQAASEQAKSLWEVIKILGLSNEKLALQAIREAFAASTQTPTPVASPLQQRVQPWLMACFGKEIAGDRQERNHRFLEEALELVQACGCTAHEAHQLVEYVFGRPVGEKDQEVGGVMITLAALCLANDLNMHEAGERELARIWTMVEKIRAKQAAKPKHSPLPAASEPRAPVLPTDDEIKDACPYFADNIERRNWIGGAIYLRDRIAAAPTATKGVES